MLRKNYLALSFLAFLVVTSGPALLSAHEGVTHKEGEAAAHETPHAPQAGLQAEWQNLQAQRAIIAEAVEKADLKAIHEPSEKMLATLENMKRAGEAELTADRATRLASTLNQAKKVIDDMHVAADANDKEKTNKLNTQLSSVFRLIDANIKPAPTSP